MIKNKIKSFLDAVFCKNIPESENVNKEGRDLKLLDHKERIQRVARVQQVLNKFTRLENEKKRIDVEVLSERQAKKKKIKFRSILDDWEITKNVQPPQIKFDPIKFDPIREPLDVINYVLMHTEVEAIEFICERYKKINWVPRLHPSEAFNLIKEIHEVDQGLLSLELERHKARMEAIDDGFGITGKIASKNPNIEVVKIDRTIFDP